MSPAKNNTKNKNTKKYAARREPYQRQASIEDAGTRIFCGVIFLLLGALTAISYFVQDGTFVAWLRRLLSGVFGYGFWALAVCLIWVAVVIFQGRVHSILRIVCIMLIPVLFSSVIDLLSYSSSNNAGINVDLLFKNGQNFKCGGVLSGLIVNGLVQYLSKVGLGVVLLILLLVCVAMAVSEPRQWYGGDTPGKNGRNGRNTARPSTASRRQQESAAALNNVKATASGVGRTLGVLWNGEGTDAAEKKSFASSLVRMNDPYEGDMLHDLRDDPRASGEAISPALQRPDYEDPENEEPHGRDPEKPRSLFEGSDRPEKMPEIAPIRVSRRTAKRESVTGTEQIQEAGHRSDLSSEEKFGQKAERRFDQRMEQRTGQRSGQRMAQSSQQREEQRSARMPEQSSPQKLERKPVSARRESEYPAVQEDPDRIPPNGRKSPGCESTDYVPKNRDVSYKQKIFEDGTYEEKSSKEKINQDISEEIPEGFEENAAKRPSELRREPAEGPVRMTASSRNDIKDPEKITRKDTNKAARSIASQISKNANDPAIDYDFPPTVLLNLPKPVGQDSDREIHENKVRLENALHSFGVNSAVVRTTHGPTVTRYDIELEQGVKLTKVTNLSNDLALALGVSSVRIAPIPDEISTVGIEVPNKIINTVSLREILESEEFVTAKSRLSFAIGKDIGGRAIVGNISKLPHMLIAGTTGSGKSVCMNSLIISLLYKSRPEEVKLIMIDPKMVELGIYNSIPHLYVPVVTEPKKAAGALQWSVVEMLKRYRLFSEVGMRDLQGYNQYCRNNGEPTLPQVVIVIDELADLMMAASKEVEESICRIAQMGRAAGMHLIIATQRPSADVITGLMKANIPSRIAFAVSSALESRIILDQAGADKLIGMGDMLYAPIGCGKPLRVQGAFVSDEEREKIIKFISAHSSFTPSANEELNQFMDKAMEGKGGGDSGSGTAGSKKGGDQIAEGYDEMLPEAVEVVLEMKSCSVSMLQRRIKLGYSRAARIVDQMEELGVVGPYEGAKPRSVPITREDWEFIKAEKLGLGSTDDDYALAASMNEE